MQFLVPTFHGTAASCWAMYTPALKKGYSLFAVKLHRHARLFLPAWLFMHKACPLEEFHLTLQH